LLEWGKQNEFRLNKEKTINILFRKGGRAAILDHEDFEGDKLEMVSLFKYLCFTVQTTGYTYTQNMKDRTAAVRAMQDIKNPNLLSLNTAMKLFNAKITPILPQNKYGNT
jgi:hypothetical protein